MPSFSTATLLNKIRRYCKLLSNCFQLRPSYGPGKVNVSLCDKHDASEQLPIPYAMIIFKRRMPMSRATIIVCRYSAARPPHLSDYSCSSLCSYEAWRAIAMIMIT